MEIMFKYAISKGKQKKSTKQDLMQEMCDHSSTLIDSEGRIKCVQCRKTLTT